MISAFRTLCFAFALTCFIAPFAARAADALKVSGTPDVVFNAAGPLGFKMQGKTDEVKIDSGTDKMTFTVPLKKLTTGIDLRDNHMRDKYIEVAKYPDATLEVPAGKVPLKAGAGEVDGTFTVHGVSKPVKVKYAITSGGDKLFNFEGNFRINIKDHNINVPSYMGVTVKPDIEIVAKFKVTQ